MMKCLYTMPELRAMAKTRGEKIVRQNYKYNGEYTYKIYDIGGRGLVYGVVFTQEGLMRHYFPV